MISQGNNVTEIALMVRRLKWQWAGHIYCKTDDSWSKRVLDWKPRLGKRSMKRSLATWRDNLRKRCEKQQTGLRGKSWERSTCSSGLERADDNDLIDQYHRYSNTFPIYVYPTSGTSLTQMFLVIYLD